MTEKWKKEYQQYEDGSHACVALENGDWVCDCGKEGDKDCEDTTNLIVSLHNAAIEINEKCPQAVAEGMVKMYEALKDADETICELCKRLNPQHATADYGEGCKSCADGDIRLEALNLVRKELKN